MSADHTTYTSLKGFANVGDTMFSTCWETNLGEWFKWGLLNKGGFFNIQAASSGHYGGNLHTLKYVDDDRYNSGQVFQTYRAPIVWESGLEYGTQPVSISGVTVDGTFLPRNTTGASGYHIDYNLGRVVFATGIDATSTVTMEYSHYWANVHTSRKAPWLQRAFQWASRVDNSHYSQVGSGHFDLLRDNRVELPAVVFEIVPNYRAVGKCLGGGREVFQDFFAHVWASDPWDRNQLKDALLMQWGKRIFLFDLNQMENSGSLPLKNNCDLRNGATTYPTWVAPIQNSGSFRYRCADIESVNAIEIIRPQEGLFTCTVRGVLRVDVGNI